MKKILLYFLLSIFVISCGNDFVSPSSYTKEEIDKKYPYWNVGVAGFWVDGGDTNASLTVAEKRLYLESLALIRLTINTEEFVETYKEHKLEFLADKTATKSDGALYESTIGEPFDIDRLIEVIRATKYDVNYGKGSHTTEHFYGVLGGYYYAYYGSSKQISTGSKIWSPNRFLANWYGLAFFSAIIYHEHLHNIGFSHIIIRLYILCNQLLESLKIEYLLET